MSECCNLTVFVVITLHFHRLPEVPSAPSISEVRPFSTTAQIQFEEPESTGGVPVLKYRVEWRTQGRGSWAQRVYEVQDGKNTNQNKNYGCIFWKCGCFFFGKRLRISSKL